MTGNDDIDNNLEPAVVTTMIINKLRERTVTGNCPDCEGKGYTPLLGRCWTCMGTGNREKTSDKEKL